VLLRREGLKRLSSTEEAGAQGPTPQRSFTPHIKPLAKQQWNPGRTRDGTHREILSTERPPPVRCSPAKRN